MNARDVSPRLRVNLLPRDHVWTRCNGGTARACRYCTAFEPAVTYGRVTVLWGPSATTVTRLQGDRVYATRRPFCRRRRYDYVRAQTPAQERS